MNPIEVASYLANNPHFFEQHADLFSTIKLASPILGRTISLQERQMEVVRDKYRQLELRLTELIRIAQENDATALKINDWTQKLLMARNDIDLPHIFTSSMKKIFNLPHATIRCWNVPEDYAPTWFAAPVSDDVRLFARSLTAPFCGKNMDFEAAGWLAADQTSPATTTRGDVRGTVQVSAIGGGSGYGSTSSNGSIRFATMMSVPLFNLTQSTPVLTTPMFGVTQA